MHEGFLRAVGWFTAAAQFHLFAANIDPSGRGSRKTTQAFTDGPELQGPLCEELREARRFVSIDVHRLQVAILGDWERF